MNDAIHKTALITGGSGGLGKDAALRIAASGHDVLLTYYRNAERAQEVVAAIEALGQQAMALPLDVREVGTLDQFVLQVKGALESMGKSGLDFLVNNAGTGAHGLVTQTEEAVFDDLFQVHFKGVFFLTQALLPLIQEGGRIINISTGLTRFAFPGYAAYASMKGAIETYTKYLAKELGERGIAANVVAPGAIDNAFNAAAFAQQPEMRAAIAGNTALGRVGQSEDIGGIVAFLCSDAGRWINAQRIEASGGMFL